MCPVASKIVLIIPTGAAIFHIHLMILKGQKMLGSQACPCPCKPLPHFWELNLTICAMPLLELNNRSTFLLVQNLTHVPIQVTAQQTLGMLVDSFFHDFEPTIPVIGELPLSLNRVDHVSNVSLTFPTKMITVASSQDATEQSDLWHHPEH